MFQIVAGLNVIPTKTGQVFDHDAVGLSIADRFHHGLETRPPKIRSGFAVVLADGQQR